MRSWLEKRDCHCRPWDQNVPVRFPGTLKATVVWRAVKRAYWRTRGTVAMDRAGRWARATSGYLVCKVQHLGFYPIHSFIHSPSKYLLRAYHVQGSVFDVEAAHEQNTLRPYPHGADILVEGQTTGSEHIREALYSNSRG